MVHGDIKPTNILISYPKGALCAQLKLADFGLFHCLDTDESDRGEKRYLPAATDGWFCPSDAVDENGNREFNFDIFPLGCVLAFSASHGIHPFGIHLDEAINRIKIQRSMKLELTQIDESIRTNAFLDLVKQMVNYDASKRPSATKILNHHLFQIQPVVSFQNQNKVRIPVVDPKSSTSSSGQANSLRMCRPSGLKDRSKPFENDDFKVVIQQETTKRLVTVGSSG
jgi:serine/threonine protein kinase